MMNEQTKLSQEIAAMRFPKRFELEGLNPLECPVKIVVDGIGATFIVRTWDRLTDLLKETDFTLSGLVGPFADKHNGQWCVRFESKSVHKALSC